jgi:hypothetical protein
VLYGEQIPDLRDRIDQLADDIYEKICKEKVDPALRKTPTWRSIRDGFAAVLRQSLQDIRNALDKRAAETQHQGKPSGEFSAGLKEAAQAVADAVARMDMPRVPRDS